MFLRGFYFLLILLVIVFPTWALWIREPLCFNREKVEPLNSSMEASALRGLPYIFASLLLFAVLGFAYPQWGFFRHFFFTVLVSASVLTLTQRVLFAVKRRERIRQIFEGWLPGESDDDCIWLGCGGYARKLFLQSDYIVFSVSDSTVDKLSGLVQKDLTQIYRQIHYVEGKAYARVGPHPESIKDVLRCCKTFPRAEYIMLRSGPDSIVIKF